jgi:hypothetical protein
VLVLVTGNFGMGEYGEGSDAKFTVDGVIDKLAGPAGGAGGKHAAARSPTAPAAITKPTRSVRRPRMVAPQLRLDCPIGHRYCLGIGSLAVVT